MAGWAYTTRCCRRWRSVFRQAATLVELLPTHSPPRSAKTGSPPSVAGVSRRHVALAVLKRTLPSVMPLVGLVLVSLTGGAIAVEKYSRFPGLGRATLGAAAARDLPALQIGVLILLLIASLAGIAASGVRLLILGRALRSGAMPVPEERGSPVSRYAIWLPVICVLLLALLLLAGLPRDPIRLPFYACNRRRYCCLLARTRWGVIYWRASPTAR